MDLATFVARARRPYLSTESNQSKHKICFSFQKNVCNNQSDLISINQTHQLRFSLRNRKQNVSSLSHRGSDFYSLAQRSTVSPFLTIVVGNFRRCGRLVPRSFSSDKCGHSVLEPNSSRANRVERVRLMLVPGKLAHVVLWRWYRTKVWWHIPHPLAFAFQPHSQAEQHITLYHFFSFLQLFYRSTGHILNQ